MTDEAKFDDEAARRLEVIYQTPDVVHQRLRTLRALGLRPGQRVLDLGAGPGFLTRDIAASVGETGLVRGLDASEAMLERARARCRKLPWARFDHGDVTALPYEDASFDAAVCVQVYAYVPAVRAALAQLFRVVAPGGRVVIVDTDYASWVLHTSDPERFARIRAAWDEHSTHRDLPRRLIPLLREAGFGLQAREIIPMFNTEYHPHTYSHGLLDFVARFVVGRHGLGEADSAAFRADLEALGRSGAFFFSLNRYLFVAHRTG